MTMPAEMASRIEALEIRAAYQDQTIEDLNRTITDQWREIERLQRLLKRLEEQVNEGLAAAGGPNLPEPPPPHY